MKSAQLRTFLQSALVEFFARNQGAQGRRDYYGVSVSKVRRSSSLLEFAVSLTFKRGERYCCFEDGCHHGLHFLDGWTLFRRALEADRLALPPRIVISRFRVRVQRGSRASYGGLLSGDREVVRKSRTYQRGPFSEPPPANNL